MPGYPCCCVTADPMGCADCGYDEDTTFEIDIDGVTYVTTVASIGFSSCTFSYYGTAPYACGDITFAMIQFLPTPGQRRLVINVATGIGATYVVYEVIRGAQSSCESTSGTVAYVGGTPGACAETQLDKTYSVTATRLT